MGLSSKEVSSNHSHGKGIMMLKSSSSSSSSKHQEQSKQEQSEPLKCPRCDSTKTKFCYYNNYNKSQPRHFCKVCKRHWTKGGTLRNVPVGGGRKNKRKLSKPAVPKTTAVVTIQPPQQQPRLSQVPLGTLEGVDEKNLSETFYRTLGRHSSCSMPESSNTFRNNEIFLGCLEQELNFPYSNLGSFESSIQSPSIYNFTVENQANYSLEETMMNIPNTDLIENNHQQQQISWSMGDNSSSNLMGISSTWGWDDFDESELTIPWDDDGEGDDADADNIKP